MPPLLWKHIVQDNFHLSYDGIRSAAANDLCRRKIQTAADSYFTTEALKNTDIPILFIHGSDDHFVPVEMTYENYKACASEKHLLIVPGAEHAMSYVVDKEKYENAIRRFWQEQDKKGRTGIQNPHSSTQHGSVGILLSDDNKHTVPGVTASSPAYCFTDSRFSVIFSVISEAFSRITAEQRNNSGLGQMCRVRGNRSPRKPVY